MEIFDIIVAGGGPAGTAAAITAARAGARVLLIERGLYPRQKVCGEFVSPESLAVLRSLLLHVPEALAQIDASPRISNASVFFGKHRLQMSIDPAAASVARHDLDAWLWQASLLTGVRAKQSIEIRNVARIADDTFSVTTDSGNAFEATVVINAAGRSSRLQPISRPGEKWIGIKAHFRSSGKFEPNVTELYGFRGGYCGVQAVRCCGELLINACALIHPEAARTIEQVLTLHPKLHETSHAWTRVTDPVTTAAVSFHKPQTVRDGVFLAGDAAGFIDPFVGDGIAIALRSGSMAGEIAARLASRAIDSATAMREYSDRYQALFAGAFRNARRLRKLLDMPAAARGAALTLLKIPGATDFLVKKTRSA